MQARASNRRPKRAKKATIRARVTPDFKKTWLDFVTAFGGDEDESTLLRRAVKELMDKHKPNGASKKAALKDVTKKTVTVKGANG